MTDCEPKRRREFASRFLCALLQLKVASHLAPTAEIKRRRSIETPGQAQKQCSHSSSFGRIGTDASRESISPAGARLFVCVHSPTKLTTTQTVFVGFIDPWHGAYAIAGNQRPQIVGLKYYGFFQSRLLQTSDAGCRVCGDSLRGSVLAEYQ